MTTERKTLTYIFLLTLAIVGLTLAQTKQISGSLRGRVTLAGTQEPVAYLNVVVVGTGYGTMTNEQGQLSITGLPPGTYEVKISGIGYAAITKKNIVISAFQTTTMAIQVDQEPVQFAEVQASANVKRVDPARPVSTQRLSSLELQSTVGGFDDVFRSISILPGIAPASIERNDLIVRGGAPSENLFIVDNIEVPTLNHFSTQGSGGGSSSVIALDFIDRVTFSSGGFGVQHGDRLSSVTSLALREGDREHHTIKATVSATEFGASLEGPISSKASYLFSARKSYLELVFKAYDLGYGPDFMDALAKVSVHLGSSDKIDLLAVAKRDKMHLFNDTESHRADNADVVFGDQNSVVSGITWKHFSEDVSTFLTVDNTYDNYRYFQLNADQTPNFNDDSYENETSLSFDAMATLSEATDLSAGVKGKFIMFRDRLHLQSAPWFLQLNHDVSDIRRSIDTIAEKFAAYVQISQTIGGVVINAGIRAEYFNLIADGLVYSPRLSAIYHLSPITDVTGNIGRYYQSPAYKWMANSFNRNLLHSGADQIVLGIVHHLSEEWKVNLEGYSKTYFDYPISIEVPVITMFNAGSGTFDFKDFGLDSLASRGSGISRGIELFVQKRAADSLLSGSLSVSYSRTEFTPLDGISRPADHDIRWIVNLSLDCLVASDFEIGTRFRLYSGHPYLRPDIAAFGTMAEYYKEYNASRVGWNHSLDLRITRRWRLSSMAIEAFLDVQNVYNRRPLDTPHFDYNTSEYTDVKVVRILPSIGLMVKF
jgi:hypothetical protein